VSPSAHAPRGHRCLNLGVLGLGRRWQRRFRPALQALAGRFRIAAVCDPIAERAEREGHRLRCEVAAGPTELLEDEELHALLILQLPWYGLWPLELACKARTPVLCAAPLDPNDSTADASLRLACACQSPVMIGTSLKSLPAAVRVRELLDGPLGPARLVLCDWVHARGPTKNPISGALLDWCVSLIGASPTAIQVMESPTARLAICLMEFDAGRAVHIVCRRGDRGTAPRCRVVAQRGCAVARLPGSVRWTDDTGRHMHRLPMVKSSCGALLERFHRAILDGSTPEPGPDDARRTLTWLRAVAHSRADNRRVPLGRLE
jgi:predicted dehydrogenase